MGVGTCVHGTGWGLRVKEQGSSNWRERHPAVLVTPEVPPSEDDENIRSSGDTTSYTISDYIKRPLSNIQFDKYPFYMYIYYVDWTRYPSLGRFSGDSESPSDWPYTTWFSFYGGSTRPSLRNGKRLISEDLRNRSSRRFSRTIHHWNYWTLTRVWFDWDLEPITTLDTRVPTPYSLPSSFFRGLTVLVSSQPGHHRTKYPVPPSILVHFCSYTPLVYQTSLPGLPYQYKSHGCMIYVRYRSSHQVKPCVPITVHRTTTHNLSEYRSGINISRYNGTETIERKNVSRVEDRTHTCSYRMVPTLTCKKRRNTRMTRWVLPVPFSPVPFFVD